jgi:SRSO17 transposase
VHRRELLIEWPAGEAEPTKYWLATVDQKMAFRGLVDIVKMRWRIEPDNGRERTEGGMRKYAW